MLIVGLTGSIGMGKSTAAQFLRSHGIPVFDTDAAVHDLYGGAAVEPIARLFPSSVTNAMVDRAKLSAMLAHDPKRFSELEAIVHPLVREAERAFIDQSMARAAEIAVLEVPLLFETGADRVVDATIVVTAGAEEQRRRVLARPGMSAEKFELIRARQLEDDEKRRRADFVVDTSGPVADTHRQIDQILAQLRKRPALAYGRNWRPPGGGAPI